MAQVINTTSANLKKYKEEQIKAIKKLIAVTAKNIEIEAIRNSPRDLDDEIFINVNTEFYNKGMTAEVGIMGGAEDEKITGTPQDSEDGRGKKIKNNRGNNLAAYLEFGTGLSASSILAPYPQWVKDIARLFFINGLGTITGKPFFYPAVLKNKPIFEKGVKDITDKETKDNG